jgi:hypothetical protein
MFYARHRSSVLCKDLQNDIKIAIDGYHASLMYEEIASNDDGKPFDYILRVFILRPYYRVKNNIEKCDSKNGRY